MEFSEVRDWYSNFTDININVGLVNHMKEIGMLSENIDLDTLNSFMLVREGNEYITNKEGKYIVKESRKLFNNSFSQKNVEIPIQKNNANRKPLKFKIEKTGNKRLKLIKNWKKKEQSKLNGCSFCYYFSLNIEPISSNFATSSTTVSLS